MKPQLANLSRRQFLKLTGASAAVIGFPTIIPSRVLGAGVPVLEQPLPANRLTGYRRLKKQGALPIIMD